MTLKTRIEALEKVKPPTAVGQILACWQFDTPADYERAKLQHVKDYPKHQGVRFIEYGEGANIRHEYQDPD